jgi:hypothetical protein
MGQRARGARGLVAHGGYVDLPFVRFGSSAVDSSSVAACYVQVWPSFASRQTANLLGNKTRLCFVHLGVGGPKLDSQHKIRVDASQCLS